MTSRELRAFGRTAPQAACRHVPDVRASRSSSGRVRLGLTAALVTGVASGIVALAAAAGSAGSGKAPSQASATAPPKAPSPSAAPAPAPSAEATTSVSTAKARIGDRIRLTASYSAAGTWTAAPGDEMKPGEKLGPFHILGVDASALGVLVLDLGADETGELATPSFPLVFHDPSGAAVTVTVPPVKVAVASVLAEGDSTAIADLKPPAELAVPWPWATLALLGAAVVAAVGATWWLARWLRRARAPRPVAEVSLPPGVTPEAWARDELGKLLASGLIEAGRHREFHIALADLLRRYIELRFRVPAMERTTEEIGDEMPRALVGGEIARLTVGALTLCDRVKFAKHVPGRDEIDAAVAHVRAILDLGAPAPAPAAPAAHTPAPPASVDAAGTAA